MIKQDFLSRFPFAELEYATRIRVHYADGHVREYRVNSYWPQSPDCVDILDCQEDGVISETILSVPDPNIQSIEVLAKSAQPNRPSHPEMAYVIQKIDALFASLIAPSTGESSEG